jgi:hypothetical protein
MKTIFLVLIAAITLFSCKKEDRVRELPSGTRVELPTDPELFNHEMDRQAASKRRYPPKNPHYQPPDQPPPPTEVKKVCLLIDTNGEEVTNTVWSVGTISCASSGLSETQVQSVVNRVKYDWSQFDAEVTTDENVYNTYPQNKRRRCVVTTTNWYGNVGGVAYINSLNWFDDTPCFVFSSLLGFNEKYVSDATSHEFGHTAGCRHHAELRNDETGVCYIYSSYLWSNHLMGASYYDANPIFTIGDWYCGVKTDDIIIINNSINL